MPGVDVKISGSSDGLKRATQDAQEILDRFKKKANAGGGGGAESIFEREGKVKRNLAGIVSDLSNVTSWTEAGTRGFERLGDVFHTSMGVGIVSAVGVALMNMGAESIKAFEEMKTGATEAHAEVQKLLNTGGILDLAAGYQKAGEEIKKVNEAKGKTGGLGDIIGGGMGIIQGGPSLAEKRSEMDNMAHQKAFDRMALQFRALNISEKDLQVAKLKADELDKTASALERQAALEKTILAIRASGFEKAVQEKLIANEKMKAALEDAKSLRDTFKNIGGGLQSAILGLAAGVPKLFKEVDDKAKEQEKLRADRLKNLDDAEKEMTLNPSTQHQKERREQREQRRRDRHFVDQQLDELDRANRRAGGSGLNTEDRQKTRLQRLENIAGERAHAEELRKAVVGIWAVARSFNEKVVAVAQ